MSEMREAFRELIVVACRGSIFKDEIWAFASPQKRPLIYVDNDIASGYDTGKYIWAFETYKDTDRFLFIQDSVIPYEGDWSDPFFNPDHEVIAWSGFPWGIWDTEKQIQEAVAQYGYICPRLGIFGPIFSATRSALEKIKLPSIPYDKLSQQGKEREWAMAFELAGIPVHHLVEHFDMGGMGRGQYPCFKKLFPKRP